jgi:hypothetical protein
MSSSPRESAPSAMAVTRSWSSVSVDERDEISAAVDMPA